MGVMHNASPDIDCMEERGHRSMNCPCQVDQQISGIRRFSMLAESLLWQRWLTVPSLPGGSLGSQVPNEALGRVLLGTERLLEQWQNPSFLLF